MNKKDIKPSALHEISPEIEMLLLANKELLLKWNSLTPLMRNEWICWCTMPKMEKTRKEHLLRMQEDILKGKKRPCCWPGCPHRLETAKKYFK